jgi:hypothetical protein
MLKRLPASFLVFAVLMIATVPMASSQQPTAPAERPTTSSPRSTTPAERKRVVAIAHKLEVAPLNQALVPEREWAKQWVVENPDVRIRVCTQLLAGLRTPRYKYRTEITVQMMLSTAAFLIEHPAALGDNVAENVGGLQGVLKAYAAIVKNNRDPDAHAKRLDDLLQKQKEGKLLDYARETMKNCHASPR